MSTDARSPSEIEIGCMQSASSSEVTGDDSPKKKKTSKGSKDSNQIDYKIQTGRSGLTVSVQYTDAQAQTGDDGGLLPKLPKGGSGTTQYEIVFDKIIEYVKDDPDSINKEYDFENDKVVRTVDLDKWNDISEDESNGSSDNKIYYSASSSDGVAEFNFFVEVT